MAAIDYAGIEDQFKTILEADASMAGVRVYVEEEPQFGMMDNQKAVSIFLHNRMASSGQPLSAGKRQRYDVRYSLWCTYFSMESFRVACTGRDALLGAVELVLMAPDRTIGGKANSSWLEGGQFLSARDDAAGVFVASAEIILVANASAITT